MALIDSTGYHHVRITVTDIERSRAFYDRLFGWDVAIDDTENYGKPGVAEASAGFYGGVVYQTPDGNLFGLRPVGKEPFDPDATGLDHLSFSVAARSDLEAAVGALDEVGVTHGEIVDLTDAGIAFLSIQDPDNINIEVTAPLG
ncbi:glyoxalase [Marmoricola endophyticus]|uniref:Glyoxalase n=1 Tax=Marmoricola endophyticus TaxID=2040280 RepID=A0A917F8M6_9ACTN|nr:VOC family protein [Marmoricola endophyticus]GGF56874.1 glyoxalase [Marmoricola endophyticus]